MDAKRGACPEGDEPVRRGTRVVRARARPTGIPGSALRMGVRACAAILLAWEGCEHLREGRLCARDVRLVASRGLAGGRAAKGADRRLHLALRRTAFRRTVRGGRRKQRELLGAGREYPGCAGLDRARIFVVVVPDRAAGTGCPLEALAGQCPSRVRTADRDMVIIV